MPGWLNHEFKEGLTRTSSFYLGLRAGSTFYSITLSSSLTLLSNENGRPHSQGPSLSHSRWVESHLLCLHYNMREGLVGFQTELFRDQGKFFTHLNIRNKQKDICQGKDAQNTEDTQTPSLKETLRPP